MDTKIKTSVWVRAVRTAEGIMAITSLLVLLGTPLMVMHDRINRLEHVLESQSEVLAGLQKANERHEGAIQILSERLARIEEKVTQVRDWVRPSRE